MNLAGLLPLLWYLPEYGQLVQELRHRASRGANAGPCQVQVPPVAWSHVLAGFYRDLGLSLVVLTSGAEEAKDLRDQLEAWCPPGTPVYLFPEPDALPYERLPWDATTRFQRLRALATLCGTDASHPPALVVASAHAAMAKTVPLSTFREASHRLEVGMRASPQALVARWLEAGYTPEHMVEVPGTFSRRGGIVDVFSPHSDYPVRIEFFGERIESLRLFDPASQRSVSPVSQASVVPARELVLPSEKLERLEGSPDGLEFYIPLYHQGAFLDYLPSACLLVMADPGRWRGEAEEAAARAEELRQEQVRRGDVPADFPHPYWTWPEVARPWEGRALALALEPWESRPETPALHFVSPPSYGGQLPLALAEVAARLQKRERVVIVSHQAQRLAELLREDHNIFANPREQVGEPPPAGSLTLVQGGLPGGFAAASEGHLVLLSDMEVFGIRKLRRQARKHPVRQLSLAGIAPGDYLVHEDHGIGRFLGTTTSDVSGATREYLVLEYAQGDKLYVPTDHLQRLGPYHALGNEPPSLSRLGSGEWARAKEKAAEAAAKVAQDLTELYAHREVLPGTSFSPDSTWQRELESSFPYVETPDQLRAVQEVKADMEAPRPMDRLVCGDVGYGKTEVALRAAFKAVCDGYQVAVLVPTTVLAQQHYETFQERLAPFPVQVRALSRFRSLKEQQEVVAGLAAGSVDIVIGTHRLLQKDVALKRPGLVIIDEEHRFGVLHKERLKQMRREVDVLALSATPIPRTLYMSLVSVRDMSTMETPPEERLPIKTYVSPYNESLVREALLRELDRGGQVFFVHNRVQDIELVSRRLQDLVPEARLVIGHGQMPEEDLEAAMMDFASGKSDVLVCTTIIEAGLDLPNVNTLIIYPADKLGLAQLYQLRGRVGRGRNKAYAYLLFDQYRPITETARRRLGTIRDATELGAGFRIAMKDLEIRGAGNLLGTAQHGHIVAVGFDLYCRLLAQAVEELRARLRGEPPPPLPAPGASVDLPLTAHIPEEYVPHLPSRLLLYQRLARTSAPEDTEAIRQEWLDRFGPLPQAVEDLLYVVRVKALATRAGLSSVAAEGGHIVLRARDRLRVP
ncbi:MAG: transcription-repair coupling factor, partial [Chloroflexi bacterium]|nr:transcription-repair coupling factor [Chloroflexota bacterium]